MSIRHRLSDLPMFLSPFFHTYHQMEPELCIKESFRTAGSFRQSRLIEGNPGGTAEMALGRHGAISVRNAIVKRCCDDYLYYCCVVI